MTENRSILIVEDESLIAMMLEDCLEALGHRVAGTVDNVEDAIARVAQGGFDAVILDVQLREGKKAWPVADSLAERGIPFVLATGGHVEPPPEQHADVPVLAKPYTLDAIDPALTKAINQRAS